MPSKWFRSTNFNIFLEILKKLLEETLQELSGLKLCDVDDGRVQNKVSFSNFCVRIILKEE